MCVNWYLLLISLREIVEQLKNIPRQANFIANMEEFEKHLEQQLQRLGERKIFLSARLIQVIAGT